MTTKEKSSIAIIAMYWWRRDAPGSCCLAHSPQSKPIPANPVRSPWRKSGRARFTGALRRRRTLRPNRLASLPKRLANPKSKIEPCPSRPMNIVVGVTGGIAAYKAAEMVRSLQEHRLQVQVVMTRAAQEFVRPLTFAALTGQQGHHRHVFRRGPRAQSGLRGRTYRRGAVCRCLAAWPRPPPTFWLSSRTAWRTIF